MNFFTRQFIEENNAKEYAMLEVIPKIITAEQNQQMTQLLTHEEVNKVVFNMSKG